MKGGEKKISIEEMDAADLLAIVERAKPALSDHDHATLRLAIETLAIVTTEILAKNASIMRLKKLLFGASTEKIANVLGGAKKPTAAAESAPSLAIAETPQPESTCEKTKRKGHGRNGVIKFPGATRIPVSHAQLKAGDPCPKGCGSKVYDRKRPIRLIRFEGIGPVTGSIYECESLRCAGCGEVFTADAPEGVGAKKYDETVSAMVAVLKYGGGMPFHRIEKLQKGLGVPLASGTQWDLIEEAVEAVEPAFEELLRQAAQGDVVHNDDTTMKILEYDPETLMEAREEKRKRTGTFTSGIISKVQERLLALFCTGRDHAGENLAKVLAHREEGLAAPVQMCDALSRNLPGKLKTILANCLAHARRRFVDVVENFPEECRHVLETLAEVYRHDEIARDKKWTPEERLRFHQEKSAPLMDDLKECFEKQFAERIVEPNSGLGEAITYMLEHWEGLTLFLREPGAPLDNNVCERALKKAILNRKNAYFYKTENGARVGDIFMSLIHTAELNDANPFDYLVALQRNAERVKETPAAWMPWNYRETLVAPSAGPNHPP